MSIVIPPLTIIAGQSNNVQLPNANIVKAVIISNKSSYDLIIQGLDENGPRWQPAGIENAYYTSGNKGALVIAAINTAQIISPPPSICLITVYYVGEDLPSGSWPVSIPVQTVNTQTVTTIAEKIVNDGNASGTQIIEAKPSGDSNSAVSLTNDAQFILGDAAHSGYFKTQQIDTDGLQVFGAGIAMYGGKIFGNGGWVWVDFSTDLDFFITAKRNIILNSRVSFISGTITRISYFSGTGTGTFNHGLGATPTIVIVMCHVNGSQTQGYDSENGTNVHITSGAGLNWTAIAIAS